MNYENNLYVPTKQKVVEQVTGKREELVEPIINVPDEEKSTERFVEKRQ